MGCTNCPETEAGVVHYIVYTGGGPKAQYLVLRNIIPSQEGVIPQYGILTITDRGELRYVGGQEAPVQEGWEKSGELHRPIWPNCCHRALKVQMQDTGLLTVEGRCMSPSMRLHKTLTLIECKACKNREPI